jgi:hypothetical protein
MKKEPSRKDEGEVRVPFNKERLKWQDIQAGVEYRRELLVGNSRGTRIPASDSKD